MPRGRAAILILDLNIDSKSSSNSRATPARPVRITSAHHQTVFEPPFMTASAPPLAFMTVDSGTRWLPEPLNLRRKVGAGVPPSGPTTGCPPPQSLGRRPNGGRGLLESPVHCRFKVFGTL